MRWFLAVLFMASCSKTPVPAADAGAPVEMGTADAARDIAPDLGTSCVPLFGVPGERTGLGDEQCGPSCGCEGVVARQFAPAELDAWLQWELAELPEELTEDPYEGPEPPAPGDEVCVAVFDDTTGTYTLETRSDAAGGVVTHAGACGLCSSLEDLVTYVRNPDLTEPVRECGLLGVREGEEENLACLEELGFTRACAQIWYYNTLHTRNECLLPCFELIDAPYHEPDGGLNECLACDETNSGPVFKHVAGRTRRNSGLASAICRPCETVASVSHDYPSR